MADEESTPVRSARPAQRARSSAGLVTVDALDTGRVGAIGGAQDTRNADYTYAAGDVIIYIASLGTSPPVGFETLSTPWKCVGWVDSSGGIFALSHTTKDIGAAGSLSAIRTVITGGTKTLQFTALEALNPWARALYDDVPPNALQPASRTDSGVTITSGSATVTDSHVLATDVGSSVSGTGIPTVPVPTIVSVTAGTSFVMSASATATGTSVTINGQNSVYVLPEVPLDNRYCWLMDTIDGNKAMRLFSPNGKVTARGNDQVQQADAEMLQMTATFYPTSITVGGVTTRGELVRYIQYPSAEVPAEFGMS
jgi:hypothetical protein